MTQTPGPPAAADGYPQLGAVRKNGDRRLGVAGLLASVYADRGTPRASNLYRSSVTEHMHGVRVGDELRIRLYGDHWWASSPAGTAGRLTWSKNLREQTAYVPDSRSPFDFNDGTLHVQRVTMRGWHGRQLRRVSGARRLRAVGLADDADAGPGGARADRDGQVPGAGAGGVTRARSEHRDCGATRLASTAARARLKQSD